MVSPKKAKKKTLLGVLALIIAVVIVVVASVLVQNWWNSRPGPDPKDVSITATVGDRSIEVPPYMVCTPGSECPEGEVPAIELGPDETLTLDIPEAIHRNDWSALLIYDDPAANDQQLHAGYDADSLEIPGSVDPVTEDSEERPQLVVVEISNAMIDTDENGEEIPVSVVWSINAQGEAATG